MYLLCNINFVCFCIIGCICYLFILMSFIVAVCVLPLLPSLDYTERAVAEFFFFMVAFHVDIYFGDFLSKLLYCLVVS